MAAVRPGSFLTLHYRLAGPDGVDIINTFADKPATLSLGTGELAPAMEERLIGLDLERIRHVPGRIRDHSVGRNDGIAFDAAGTGHATRRRLKTRRDISGSR